MCWYEIRQPEHSTTKNLKVESESSLAKTVQKVEYNIKIDLAALNNTELVFAEGKKGKLGDYSKIAKKPLTINSTLQSTTLEF